MPNCLFRHEGLELGFCSFMVEKGLPGITEETGEFGPLAVIVAVGLDRSRSMRVVAIGRSARRLAIGEPYPLLAISGEQGSAKTVLSKLPMGHVSRWSLTGISAKAVPLGV